MPPRPTNATASPARPADAPAPATAACALSIVIPAYDEARRIGRTLEAIRAWAAGREGGCEVIVVDDGSRDATAEAVRTFDPGPLRVRLLSNGRNRGKGFSVRTGALAAAAPVILMTDADLSTPIDEVDRLGAWLEQGFDIVIGSRDLPDARLDPPQPRHRHLLALLFRWLRRRLLLPRLADTQCGFKLFSRRAAADIFPRQRSTGYAFDCEVLALADRLGYRIREVGVTWRNDPDSRVRPLRDGLPTLVSLLAIRRRVRRERPITPADPPRA